MKLHTAQQPVDRYGRVARDKAFAIKGTAKAFEILVSKIYKDKVTAIIRELGCNAYDAHVQAGTPEKSFFVTLPNSLNPQFVVRDYGPGLSQEDIEEVYTTFFESTKDGSNDYIGALGLGCKAPFSLVDAYVVNSYQGGFFNSYTMFKEDGLPKVRLNTPEPVATDEPDGLEVVVPVAAEDFHEYQQKAMQVFAWFPVKPIGMENLERPKTYHQQYTGRGKSRKLSWEIVSRPYHLYHSSVAAVMGNVCYPLSSQDLDFTFHGNSRDGQVMIVVHFALGELDIQAGREELSYDKKTLETIQERLSQIKVEAQEIIDAYYNKAESIYKAHLLYTKAPQQVKMLYGLGTPRFNGASLERGIESLFQGYQVQQVDLRTTGRHDPDPNPPVFLFCDTETMNDQRMSMWRKEKEGRSGYMVYTYGGGYRTTKAGCSEESLAKWAEILKGEDVSYTSSYKVQRSKAKVRQLQNPLSCRTRLGIEHRHEIEVDLDDGGIYLDLKSNNFVSLTDKGDVQNQIFHIVKLAQTHIEKRLVLVPHTRSKPFQQHEAWEPATIALYRLFRKKLKKRSFVRKLWLAENFEVFGNDTLQGLLFRDIAAHCAPDHPVRKFYDFYRQCELAHAEVSSWFGFLDYLGREPRRRMRLRNMFRQMDREFPLLYQAYRSVPRVLLKELALYATTKLHLSEQRTIEEEELAEAA